MSVSEQEEHPTVDERLDLKPGERPDDRSPVLRAARAALRLVVAFVAGVFGELFGRAFREGRVDMKGRPTGTRTVQWVSSLLYAAAVGAIVFAGDIRSHADFAVSVDDSGGSLLVPRSTLWVTVLVLLVCLALLLAGALHVTRWLRLTLFVLAGVALCELTVSSTGNARWGFLVAAASMTAVVSYAWIRRRGLPLPASDVAVMLTLILPCAIWSLSQARHTHAVFGTDVLPLLVQLAMQPTRFILVALAIVGGAAVADFALTTSDWAGEFVREQFGRRTVVGLLVGLAAWRAWASAHQMRLSIAGDATALVRSQGGALLLIAVLSGGWMALDRLADRREAATTDVDSVRAALGKVALPVAAALSITPFMALGSLFLSNVDQVLHRNDLADRWSEWWTWLTDPRGVRGQRIAVGVVLLYTSVRQARRGRRGVAELCGVVGVVLLADLATSRGAIFAGLSFRPAEVDRTGLIVTLGLTIYWAVTSSLSARRAERLVLLLILTALLNERTFITDPIGRLIGFTGIGFVLFGFVWTFLTTGVGTNADSPRFPRDSRLLLFYAQSLFGVVLLACAAVTRNSVLTGSSAGFAALGDETLGVPLLLAAFFTLLVAAVEERPWPIKPELARAC